MLLLCCLNVLLFYEQVFFYLQSSLALNDPRLPRLLSIFDSPIGSAQHQVASVLDGPFFACGVAHGTHFMHSSRQVVHAARLEAPIPRLRKPAPPTFSLSFVQ